MPRWTEDARQGGVVTGAMPQPLGIDPLVLMAFRATQARQRERLQQASKPNRMRIPANLRRWLTLLPRFRWTGDRWRALSAGRRRSRKGVSLISATVGEDQAHGVADGVASYAEAEVRTAVRPTTPR